MAIDIGDAVLTFLGDTTQLDQTFAKVGTDVPAKMAPANAAIQQTSDSVSGMAKEMAVGAQGAVELGEVTTLAGTQTTESMYQARGEAGLLGEMFGIHLPRHVRSFIAELPGVGAALSAAFAATAILFIIEAIAKGVEKIIEMREESHKLALATEEFNTGVLKTFNNLDDKVLRSAAKLDELRGDHMEALRKELELIDHQSLEELGAEFDRLAKLADALFKQLETSWYTFSLGSKGAEAALKDFQSHYELLIAQGKDKDAGDLLAGTRNSAKEVLSLMEQFKSVRDKEQSAQLIGEHNLTDVLNERVRLAKQLEAHGVNEKELDDKAIQAQRALLQVLEAQLKAKEKIDENASNEATAKRIEEANREAQEADRIAKAKAQSYAREIEIEDKLDDERRNQYIANLQEREKEAIAATKTGSEERIRIIDAAIKENEAHGFQDTAFFKSLEIEKVKAVQARIDQQQKAQLDADKQELKSAEDNAKREVETVKSSSSEQEKAISELGKDRILSQTETSRRLIASYETEKAGILKVLNDLLKEEQALVSKAETQLSNAKSNPLVTPEQIAQLKQLLAQAQTAVANTQTQIAKTTSDFHAKELAADRTHYGQALALAVAFGHQKLALDLQANHQALISAQAQLADAKARGVNTHATELQIRELQTLITKLKQEETALETSAHKGLSAWTQFSQGFRDQAQQNVKSLEQMSQEMESDVASMGNMISGAFEAMLSGQESFGQAMLHSTEKMIAQMAEQWGGFFLAKGIADVFFDPPLGAAELAAGAALMAIGGALSGLASSGSKSGSSSGASASSSSSAVSPASIASAQPTQTVNVPQLGNGALVAAPGVAVVGGASAAAAASSQAGGLSSAAGLQALLRAVSQGKDGEVHVVIHSDIPYTMDQMNYLTRTGRARLHSTTSDRAIRKT